MFALGIIDPVKVVRIALNSAVSVTALIFVPGTGFFSCTRNSVEPTIDPIGLNFCAPVNLPEEAGGFYIQFFV